MRFTDMFRARVTAEERDTLQLLARMTNTNESRVIRELIALVKDGKVSADEFAQFVARRGERARKPR